MLRTKIGEDLSTKMNILITGAGAANAICLIKLLSELPDVSKIVACDASQLASGLYFPSVSSRYLVPYATDSNFMNTINEICEKEDINVVFPCVDEELYKFSEAREQFKDRGIKVIVSNPESIQIAKDKLLCMLTLSSNGIPVPMTPHPNSPSSIEELKKIVGHLGFPLCFKLRYGRGSREFSEISSLDEAIFEFERRRESGHPFIIQEFIEGEEYSCDALAWKGEAKVIIPRRRLEIRGGISVKGKTVCNPNVSAVVRRTIKLLDLDYGCNVQLIVPEDGVPRVIEVNPRFAGTVILSVKSGINLPLLAIKLAFNEHTEIREEFKEMIMLRYWEELFLEC